VALVASRVRKEDKDFQTYEVPIKELLGEAQDGRTYQLVAEVVDNLMGRVLTIEKPNGWIKYVIFSRCEYDGNKGCIRARFDPDLREHFIDLKSHFTQYSLMEFLLLPSIYSQRIFEILKSWKDKPEITIELNDLYEMLDVPPSHRLDFAAFRRRVLEKAYKDIRSKTSFQYEWKAIKKGKSVVAIRFTFSIKSTNVVKATTNDKQVNTNNKLFIAAMKCFTSGECNYKNNSRICSICKRIN
jgi:plasmid replication initiation protein